MRSDLASVYADPLIFILVNQPRGIGREDISALSEVIEITTYACGVPTDLPLCV